MPFCINIGLVMFVLLRFYFIQVLFSTELDGCCFHSDKNVLPLHSTLYAKLG